jgi:hypothetical protein
MERKGRASPKGVGARIRDAPFLYQREQITIPVAIHFYCMTGFYHQGVRKQGVRGERGGAAENGARWGLFGKLGQVGMGLQHSADVIHQNAWILA